MTQQTPLWVSLFSRFLKLPALESNLEPRHPLTSHGSLPWQTLLEESQYVQTSVRISTGLHLRRFIQQALQ